jgi:hypothetical protein
MSAPDLFVTLDLEIRVEPIANGVAIYPGPAFGRNRRGLDRFK